MKGIYKLSLIKILNDTRFYKGMEKYIIKNNTISEIESVYNQIIGAISSLTKYVLQLSLVKDLK